METDAQALAILRLFGNAQRTSIDIQLVFLHVETEFEKQQKEKIVTTETQLVLMDVLLPVRMRPNTLVQLLRAKRAFVQESVETGLE